MRRALLTTSARGPGGQAAGCASALARARRRGAGGRGRGGRRRAAAAARAGRDPGSPSAGQRRYDSRAMPGRSSSRCSTRRLRLIVVGAVHIAQALVPMASLTGYDVTVVDPRRGLCERCPLSGRRDAHRLAGRGAGRAEARRAHRGGDADPRSEARRSGARCGAALGGVLHRSARQQADPCGAARAPERARP